MTAAPVVWFLCLILFVSAWSGFVQSQQIHVGHPLHEDESHIKEHLKDTVDVDTSKLTPDQLEFHYFKIHDFDQNDKLDGLEMLQALMHNAYGKPEPLTPDSKPIEPIDIAPYTNIIDDVLKDDDLDNDGYLSYEEYKHRAQKDR